MPGSIESHRSDVSQLAIRTVARSAALLLRALRSTWRVQLTGIERLDAALAGERPVLVAFWHARYFPLFALLEGRDACVVSNQSLRGRVIAEVAARFGFSSISLPRGDHGSGSAALRDGLRSLHACGVALDGPLGPARQIKPALLELAAELDCVIVPLSVSSAPKRVAKRRWDRRETPCPFARVRLLVGEPIDAPQALRAGVTLFCQELARSLEALESMRA